MPDNLPTEFVRLKRQLDQVKKGQRLAHGASIENAALTVNDGSGSLRTIVGALGDGTVGVQAVNGPPPPQPSAPIVASTIGGVTAAWDGLFANGAILPMDWARIEVHASQAAVFEPIPETLRSTIETAQGATVVVPTDDPVYVRLVARNTSGTASIPSVVVGPFGPAPVVADEILDNIVTASKIAAGAVNINALTESLADTASQRYVDTMGDPTVWTVLTKAAGATFTFLTGITDAPSSPTVAQATGYTVLRGTTQIPYDPDVLYRISVRARTTSASVSGTDTLYAGVLGIGADGTTYVNRTGGNSYYTQAYPAASNASQPTASGFVTYTGYLRGRAASGTVGTSPDPRVPGVVHSDVRFVSPLLYLNFGSGTSGATGIMQIDAVTIEALKTGIVDSSNLVAGSVTAAAMAADSVTATAIKAGEVTAAKIAAAAVTTAKLDALAVTADKLAANAVTADKILAGSITATALSATAIDGKTITGAVVQTATSGERITLNEGNQNLILVYDATGAPVAQLSAAGMAVKGASGAQVMINPNAQYPYMRWSNAAQTNWAYAQVTETTPGAANLELLSGIYTQGTYTDMRTRLALYEGTMELGRLRVLDPGHARYGGRLYLDDTILNLAFRNDDDPTQTTGLNVTANLAYTGNGRFSVSAPANKGTALYAETPSAHTGNLMRLFRDNDKFVVDKDGNTTIAGTLTAGNILTGTVSITPSAANTPTSALVTFPAPLTGSVFRGYATANTTVPAPSTGSGGAPNGVNSVAVSSVTGTSMMVWVNRQNTTVTNVNWQVIAS